jgi:hypothetical protein
MQIAIPVGNTTQNLAVPDGQIVGVRLPTPMPPEQHPTAPVSSAVVSALERLGPCRVKRS